MTSPVVMRTVITGDGVEVDGANDFIINFLI